jgi:hypothetical protein
MVSSVPRRNAKEKLIKKEGVAPSIGPDYALHIIQETPHDSRTTCNTLI